MRKFEPPDPLNQVSDQLSVEAEFSELRRICNGEQERFRYFVERYKGPIFRLASRRLASREEGEDVAQEVFVKAYRALDTFRFESSFFTWITRIALNLIHNRQVKLLRERSQLSMNDSLTCTLDSSECPHTNHIRSQTMERYQQTLAQLDRRFSEPLILVAFEGRSYEEVAIALEIPIGTVRSRINKARKLLKEALRHE